MMLKTSAIAGVLAVALTAHATAQEMDTPAREAILLDASTNTVLFEKNADIPFPPASMSKLMTVYMAFDAIKRGKMSLEDQVTVSPDTWRKWNNQGSTMFLSPNDVVTVHDLLLGIIVLSGNDACVVLAEYMAGSHDTFAEWMNTKAQELGMTNSYFLNANGWPADGHEMSARDLSTLAYHLATDFPDLYEIFKVREFLYKDYKSNRFNRNPLLGRFPGADGLKTGHTQESGYGLTGSAVQKGRRLILVVGGLSSMAERARESERLLQYGFRNFGYYPLFKGGETVDNADVWLGQAGSVPLVVEKDLGITLSRGQRSKMQVTVNYMGPVKAPITKGQELGSLTISAPDRKDVTVPLVAGASVEEISGFGRLGAAVSYFIFGSSAPSDAQPATAE